MGNSKYSKDNKNKILNTLIEIRKEILTMLHGLGKDLDRELYNTTEQSRIRQEVKEIAEMVRDKDKYMDKAELLEPLGKNKMINTDILINETRKKVKALLKYIRDNIVATQYDPEEFKVVEKELEDVKYLVDVKDRILRSRNLRIVDGDIVKRQNPYLRKYFKMEDDPEV